jgi:glycosyltransferase involved in cell wall biosynthesis
MSAVTRPPPARAPSLVSVVLPVLNGEPHLPEQLAALAEQDYAGPWEVVVADNGSRDRTAAVARAFAERLPHLRVVDASSRRGLNHARNIGAFEAHGDFLAFCDADDVVAPGWLAALTAAAADAHLVAGAIENRTLNGGVSGWRTEGPLQELPVKHGFLAAAPGGNCGVWADVARELWWDEAYRFGSSDIEFSWRAALAGYRLLFVPAAVISQRHRPRMRSLARQHFAYGASGCRLYRSFRPLGMPPADASFARAEWRDVARGLPGAVRSRELRGAWVKQTAFRLGRVAGSVRHRVLFP